MYRYSIFYGKSKLNNIKRSIKTWEQQVYNDFHIYNCTELRGLQQQATQCSQFSSYRLVECIATAILQVGCVQVWVTATGPVINSTSNPSSSIPSNFAPSPEKCIQVPQLLNDMPISFRCYSPSSCYTQRICSWNSEFNFGLKISESKQTKNGKIGKIIR